MRQDQPNLIRRFDSMQKYIHLLEVSIDEQDAEIKNLEALIDDITEFNNDLEQELLVNEIEYNRLLKGKDALTVRFAIARGL